jgi:AcrR family transcriptional regulator
MSLADAERRAIDGARRALDRHGWQKLSVERIAEEAGMSRVTLHRRGLTKNVILGRLTEEAIAEYRAALWPVLTDTGSAAERLERALVTICELAEQNLNLLLALDARANEAVFHDDGETDVMTRSVFTEPIERLLVDGAKEGVVATDADPTETATLLFNLVGWTYIHLRSGHGWKPDRATTSTVETALRGVLV